MADLPQVCNVQLGFLCPIFRLKKSCSNQHQLENRIHLSPSISKIDKPFKGKNKQ